MYPSLNFMLFARCARSFPETGGAKHGKVNLHGHCSSAQQTTRVALCGWHTNDFTTPRAVFHNEPHDPVAGTADGQPTHQLVPQGFSLGQGKFET